VGGFFGYFGATDLLWHDKHRIQFLAGVGVGLLFCQFCFVRFMLDSRLTWLPTMPTPDVPWIERFLRVFLPHPPPPDARWDNAITRLIAPPEREWEKKLRWYLFVTWVPLLVALLLPALRDPTHRWPLAVGIIAAIAFASGCVWGCNRWRAPDHLRRAVE